MKNKLVLLILLVLLIPCFSRESGEELNKIDHAKLGLSQSLNNLERYDEARPILEDLHARHPGDKEIALELVRALEYGRSYDIVVAILKDLEKQYPDDIEIKVTLADIFYEVGNIGQAKEIYTNIVAEDPSDIKSALKLTEILAAEQDYENAVNLCRKILSMEPDNKSAELWLARILSWNKQYDSSLAVYDNIIKNDPNAVVPMRERARLLGWDKKYDQSIAAYKDALNHANPNLVISYEMNSKYNLYNQLDIAAINHYKKWLELEPNNPEALFDLGQIYSNQMQWTNARIMYNRILDEFGGHFRARQALSKVDIYSKAAQLKTGIEMIKADSSGRLTNKRSWSTFASITQPLDEKYYLRLRQDNIWYRFKGIEQAYRQRFLVALDYYDKPEFQAGAHYTYSDYPDEHGIKSTFGGQIGYVPRDRWLINLSHLRDEVTDNGTAFLNKRYRDDYKIRGLYKPGRRMAIGADYMYSRYNNDNDRNTYGLDLGYLLSHEPRSLKVTYRYEEYQFDNVSLDYFSPESFHYNAIGLQWKHFLNKEELFWGTNDTFYSFHYTVNFDVKNETGHKLYFDFHHDWNNKCSSHFEWSRMIYEHRDTYSENRLMFFMSVYF